MADSGYPLYLPWRSDPSLFVCPDLIFPPYPQVLSPGFNIFRISQLQPYAYHCPPPPTPTPTPPPQANDVVYVGIPLVAGLAVVPQYLQPVQVNVTQVVAAGTGVFHPLVTGNYRHGTIRGHAAGRWTGNRQRRGEAASSSRDARASSQNNNTGTTSSSRGRKRH